MAEASSTSAPGDGVSWLQNLPTEVLMKIFEYVDVNTVNNSLLNVCARFRMIVDDPFFWKEKYTRKYGDNYLLKYIKLADDFSWRTCFHQSYNRCEVWKPESNKIRTIILSGVHYAAVDAVHLIDDGRKCLSGARDRGLAVWDIVAGLEWGSEVKSYQLCSKPDAHAGWIWAINSLGSDIYSSSWDNTIKVWNMDNGDLVEKNTFKLSQPVLCASVKENLLVAGLWGNLTVFDPRIGVQSRYQYNMHNRAILDVKVLGDYIISASEDRNIGVYDMRSRKSVVNFPLESESESRGYPRKICVKPTMIYIGDTKGNLHFMHPTTFKILSSHEISKKGITGICAEEGLIVASSLDSSVRMMMPTDPPIDIHTLRCTTGDAQALDYLNDIMAIGGSDNSVQVWVSKDSPALAGLNPDG